MAIICGEWDHLVTDADARGLLGALRNSPVKREVKINRATHLVYLEVNRHTLYREARQFLVCTKTFDEKGYPAHRAL